MTVPDIPLPLDAADLLRLWPDGAAAPDRIAALVRAVWGDEVAQDSLGRRNQRALALHQALLGLPLEAKVTCPDCGADNEALLPVAAVLAAASPDPGAVVQVETGAGKLVFAVPRIDDLDGAEPAALAMRLCRDPVDRLSAADLDRIAAAWEAADPAGAVELDLDCSGCGRRLQALAEPQDFVARDLDIAADRLLREIDVIARAYGWSEPAILALPQARRRRYVAMIVAAAQPQPRSLGRRA